MYDQIIDLTVSSGNSLIEFARKIADIGQTKKYLTEKDIEIERNFVSLIKPFKGGHSIFAEEENDIVKQTENLWVVDPKLAIPLILYMDLHIMPLW